MCSLHIYSDMSRDSRRTAPEVLALTAHHQSWIETFVTFCGMVRLRATVLGRLGWKPSPHPRAHALSCPPPAIYFGPGHRHFTRPALCHRAGVLRGVGPSLFSRQNNSMEEMHADLSVSILCR